MPHESRFTPPRSRPVASALALAAVLGGQVALAQESLTDELLPPELRGTPESEMQEGLDLLGEGTRLLMEGLRNELGPALEGLRDRLGDIDAYHPPELLPNGDIIIRRKTPFDEEPIPEDGVEL